MEPLIVPLRVAYTFSIPIDFDKYWTASSQQPDNKFERDAYSLEAVYGKSCLPEANLDVKGLALMPCWTGSVTSNRLQFEVDK